MFLTQFYFIPEPFILSPAVPERSFVGSDQMDEKELILGIQA